jgi:hypothetical protein
VAGKPFKKFIENQNRVMKTWVLPVDGTMYRVVLEKDTLDIWVNGTKVIKQKKKGMTRKFLFVSLCFLIVSRRLLFYFRGIFLMRMAKKGKERC